MHTSILLQRKRIPLSFYVNLLSSIISYYNSVNIQKKSFINSKNNNDHIIAIDNSHNNNHSNVMSNLGIYDITRNSPIAIDSFMSYKRNNDINQITNYIKKNLSIFKNKILVFDRLYHNFRSSAFINFLYDNDINQIILCSIGKISRYI